MKIYLWFDFFILFIFGIIPTTKSKITVEQVMKSGEMMRSVCQPKFKVSSEIINAVRSGNFADDRNLKCYTNCIMEIMQSIKKGKLQYEASLRQIDVLLPDEYKDFYRKALDICRQSGVGIKDNCEAAYTIAKCFYENNPKFIFP